MRRILLGRYDKLLGRKSKKPEGETPPALPPEEKSKEDVTGRLVVNGQDIIPKIQENMHKTFAEVIANKAKTRSLRIFTAACFFPSLIAALYIIMMLMGWAE